ncbi:hypothetical protein HO133_006931 [Letharia lupina]|uniref:Uncharacterized protein n=1 Tax=Letharia lupina TaxID=560253 RepID=A0A8H6F6A7_9LECA|nr:uncharacterized protein HO133_006931 [Letharia lupina]KAF6217415.1 hypothetical protein HO133_006931 [Letharia lupina]
MSTTQFKASISSSETATSIPKTTTIPTTVFTKISSTSTKTSSASSKAITYDIDVSYMSHSSDFLECSLQYSAQFDDRIIKPALTLLNPLGIEVNIFLNPWAVDNQPPTVGVPAHSQLNPIVTAFEQQATNGTPSLTILYPDSNLKSFDLHSFYFGYLANTSATAVDVALQCTIAVAGFREGQEVTVAGYTFTLPTVAVDVPMIQSATPYLNFSPNQNGSFSLRNLTTLESSPEIDPQFTGLVEDTGEDLFRQIHLYERPQDTG